MTLETFAKRMALGLSAAILTAGLAWADNHSATPKEETAAEEKADETKAEDTKAEDTKAEDTKAEEKAETVKPKYALGDIVLGNEEATVTVIEYASLTCPHCASFHINTWPQMKKEYIDSGKVRFIMREVYFDKYGLWASMAARCGGEAGFYPMTDVFLKNQRAWTGGNEDQRVAAIHQIGRRAGLSSERLAACLGDRDYAKALLEEYKKNAAADDVRSTPTFLINGRKVTGNMPFEEIARLIDAEM